MSEQVRRAKIWEADESWSDVLEVVPASDFDALAQRFRELEAENGANRVGMDRANTYCTQLISENCTLRAAIAQQPTAEQPDAVKVDRELLADLISKDHDTRIQAERRLYALLAEENKA